MGHAKSASVLEDLGRQTGLHGQKAKHTASASEVNGGTASSSTIGPGRLGLEKVVVRQSWVAALITRHGNSSFQILHGHRPARVCAVESWLMKAAFSPSLGFMTSSVVTKYIPPSATCKGLSFSFRNCSIAPAIWTS